VHIINPNLEYPKSNVLFSFLLLLSSTAKASHIIASSYEAAHQLKITNLDDDPVSTLHSSHLAQYHVHIGIKKRADQIPTSQHHSLMGN
jgi:hypothetical protein